jgi:hypothetical protein
MRFIAVDWSGAKSGAEKKIWLAEATDAGLARLECGRKREEVAEHLIELARSESDVVAGFDFGFSAPAWFLESRGVASGPELWALACLESEAWLASKEPPFWGGGRGGRPVGIPQEYRKSDLALAPVGGIAIKSLFQLGGSGSVGTGSLRGWPVLHLLRESGFSVWPFDDVQLPLVVEIYPRLLTGPVNKSREQTRRAYLADRYQEMAPSVQETAASCEDAFDAAISALEMARRLRPTALPSVRDAVMRLEGVIWHPGLDFRALAEEGAKA